MRNDVLTSMRTENSSGSVQVKLKTDHEVLPPGKLFNAGRTAAAQATRHRRVGTMYTVYRLNVQLDQPL